MIYRLRLYPYSGGHDDLIGDGELEVCRRRVASRIRYHRNELEYPVSILVPGREWEMESDPEGRHMIGDFEGILCIEEIQEEEPEEDDFEDIDEEDNHDDE